MLVSVQRNYESISRLMHVKQQELEQALAALAGEQGTVTALTSSLDEARSRVGALEGQLEGLRGLPAQLAELQSGQEALRREAAQANARGVAMTETISRLRQSLEDEQHKSGQQAVQLESWRKAQGGRDGEVAELKQQLAAAQGDGRALASEVRSLREALSTSKAAQAAEAAKAAALAATVTGLEDTVRALKDEARNLGQQAAEFSSAARAGEVSLQAARGTQAVLEAQLRGAQRAQELARQEHDELAAKLAATETALAEAKAATDVRDTEITRLKHTLNDVSEQLQTSLSGKMASDEVSNGLQMQLAQTRGALADARRSAAAAESAAARVAAEAEASVRAAEARAAAGARAVSGMAHRAGEAGNLLASRIEAIAERSLTRLSDRLSRGMAAEAERVDKAVSVTQLKLQSWEAEITELEAALLGMGSTIETLSSAAIRRRAEADREVSTVRGDAAALQSQVAELAAALASESAARQLLAASQAALEAEQRAALQAAQAQADERVEAERQRLGARLAAVEAEVSRLTATHAREAESAARVWASERSGLTRRIELLDSELTAAKEELRAAAAAAAKDGEHVDTATALAVLHTQLNQDLQAAKDQYDHNLRQYTEQLDSVRKHVRGAWSTCSKLATDLALVAKHLGRMGVALPPGTGELPPGLRGVGDDGGGALLEAMAGALRLGFGLLTEGVQGLVRKLQVMQGEHEELRAKAASFDPAAWHAVAGELRGTVAKLVHIEDSLAPPCTCLMCLDTFKSPVTLIPCGHTFCRKCLANANGLCTECGADSPAVMTISNAPLDAICAKYELKRSALAAIQRALQQGPGGPAEPGAAGRGAGGTAGGGGGGGAGAGFKGPAGTGTQAARAIGAYTGSAGAGGGALGSPGGGAARPGGALGVGPLSGPSQQRP
ncbi:hypothetical protein HYH03_011705 [Edaphochlamys debaryana]|uniref:RING-type domain-containing protein n=1 Tax=Edaphochlamys debaryana TaxID=47281 RepID=A0A835XTD2_9CHLO|nr:hypothetical protein HYH03_011705 [Edaphochlamys debaryana]|eukprot:KAG2489903.1 hypothetical protein HYH03_011705 [Edaphochlamys debaryana]